MSSRSPSRCSTRSATAPSVSAADAARTRHRERVRIGTSGWQYADWRGLFYPEGLGTGRWLQHYVQRFPTVEVNASFYRLLSEPAVKRWREQTPPGFEWALKGSKFITHNLKLNRPEPAVERFFAPVTPLRDVLAVVLWQLPPAWKKNLARLDEFLSVLPTGIRYAVEFRDPTWFADDAYEVLARHGVALVWLSYSRLPADFTVTADFLYVRFHGMAEQPYLYDYSRAELEPWAERLDAAAHEGKDAFVYFNNDWYANAIHNGRTLAELLGESARSWP